MTKNSLLLFASLVISGLVFTLAIPRQARAQTAPEAALAAPAFAFIFEENVTLADSVHVGATPRGQRNIVPITGGTFSGPNIRGKILPGGWDWQLALPDGCFVMEADYMIQTDDGVVINVYNKGARCPDASGKIPRILTSPVFEAPEGPYKWLNGGAYVGTVDGETIDGKPAVRIRFYKAS
jgi:hypothetical protein